MLMADREAQELFATMLENKIQPDGRTYALMLLGDLFDSTCFLKKGADSTGRDVCSQCVFAGASQRLRATVTHKLDASLDQHSW